MHTLIFTRGYSYKNKIQLLNIDVSPFHPLAVRNERDFILDLSRGYKCAKIITRSVVVNCFAWHLTCNTIRKLAFRESYLITDHKRSNIHPAGKLIIDYKQRAIDWRTLGTSRTEEMV